MTLTGMPQKCSSESATSVIEVDRVVSPAARSRGRDRPWWLASVVVGLSATALLVFCALRGAGTGWYDRDAGGWWLVTTALHAPYVVILLFLLGGVIERLGYYSPRVAARSRPGGCRGVATVCVQLPMFNEHAVTRRVIEAAANALAG